jgi:hypothetical protein
MEKYLKININIIQSMKSLGIRNMYRYSDLTIDDKYKDIDDIAIELSDGRKIICGVDEGKSNIVLTLLHNELTYDYKEDFIKNNIATIFSKNIKLGKIQNIGILKKQHDFNEWHQMSGIQIEFAQMKVILGTCLTDENIQGMWIITNKELSKKYKCQYL